MRAGLIRQEKLGEWHSHRLFANYHREMDRFRLLSWKLYSLSAKCTGMSGRTLRRLPVLAHSRYIGCTDPDNTADLEIWLDALALVVEDEADQKNQME